MDHVAATVYSKEGNLSNESPIVQLRCLVRLNCHCLLCVDFDRDMHVTSLFLTCNWHNVNVNVSIDSGSSPFLNVYHLTTITIIITPILYLSHRSTYKLVSCFLLYWACSLTNTTRSVGVYAE